LAFGLLNEKKTDDKESIFLGNFAGLQEIYEKNKALEGVSKKRAVVPDCCVLLFQLLLLLFTILSVHSFDNPNLAFHNRNYYE
jgi:hypothetical protein